ncbi:siderophore synthetase component [Roseimicrobium gellanilyticum]|uniref:Siderophore synthetase component n=1 Tax=Roseimicrobium gellanilyticum TaxID=748857 RepID=A0A366HV96_9BACT|nr:IucA/IucC family protein [Roseimicrobium gellanilyticum]RBP48192.1 siderophore synthetase component [Roseimicrobium gellanilyticum]
MHLTAADASLQAFCNCYLREVDEGLWHVPALFAVRFDLAAGAGIRDVVELSLPRCGATLAIFVRYRSLVGRHSIAEVHERLAGSSVWRKLDALTAQLRLIDEIYAKHPGGPQRLELLSRVVESHQVMERYLALRRDRNGMEKPPHEMSFIESEQAVVTGHWLHPTPKSRQGMHAWQHPVYTPELNGRFRLQFFAARHEMVIQESLLDSSAETLAFEMACHGLDEKGRRRLADLAASGYSLLPVHPLQAHWLHHQPHVRDLLAAESESLIALGELGPHFTPTSSVRTVYSEELDWMLKLSIPVKLTNSLRLNLKSELGDSVWISKLLLECRVEDEFPGFFILEDPAYLGLDLPEMEETGFEAIFRTNPFRGSECHQTVHSIAALTEEPLNYAGRSRLADLVWHMAERQGISLAHAAERWFHAYWSVAIAPVLGVYDRHGIALEAHQQNVVIGFTDDGAPEASYYRDIQGIALCESRREPLIELVPELGDLPKVFEPDDIVRNGLGYYLFFNHLYAIVHRFGADSLIEEQDLLRHIEAKLVALRATMDGPGAALIDVLLQSESLPCKANLLTRIEDRDELESECELAVYSSVVNPLARMSGEVEISALELVEAV